MVFPNESYWKLYEIGNAYRRLNEPICTFWFIIIFISSDILRALPIINFDSFRFFTIFLSVEVRINQLCQFQSSLKFFSPSSRASLLYGLCLGFLIHTISNTIHRWLLRTQFFILDQHKYKTERYNSIYNLSLSLFNRF